MEQHCLYNKRQVYRHQPGIGRSYLQSYYHQTLYEQLNIKALQEFVVMQN